MHAVRSRPALASLPPPCPKVTLASGNMPRASQFYDAALTFPNMLAVAAPAKAIAGAFKMARPPKGYAVDLARVAGAFEFMDAGRLRVAHLRPEEGRCPSPEPRGGPVFASGLQRFVLLQEGRAE